MKSKNKVSIESSNTKTVCPCTDWLSAMQNGRGAAESFSILLEFNQKYPTHYLFLTTEPWICVSLQKQKVYFSLFLATCNRFFACRIVVLGLLRLNIKARHEIPEFLNANL